MACQAYVIRNNDSLEELQEIMEGKKPKFCTVGCSFQQHISILPGTEQLHSSDKNFIVTNKSILALLQSHVTFIDLPMSII